MTVPAIASALELQYRCMHAHVHPSPGAATTFAISRCHPGDFFAILRQQRACFGSDGYDALTVVGMALSPRLEHLKATVNNALVGYVAAEHNQRERCGWIITIGVLPDFAGHGIGTALLLAAERALGLADMRLTVRRSNTRAINVYERAGYVHYGAHTRYYRNGEDGLIMRKLRAQ
jgi:ribosomal-protein-alanine N-acetyltransferase